MVDKVPTESIRRALNSDQPANKDLLGFEPYVKAIAEFLTDPKTKAPLTLSIEGKWGYGKSSFMEQLEKNIKYRDELTVRFNAWRHDREESLWAAFAIQFRDQISRQQNLFQRASSYIKLFLLRLSWENGKLDLLRVLAIWVLFLLITILISILYFNKGFQWINSFSQFFLRDNSDLSQKIVSWLIEIGGVAGLIGIIISAMIKLKSIAGSPLDFDLNKYFKSPDYETRVAFIESFHKDFSKIVKAYARNERNNIYVFIDDLDRCDVAKASDLMQAINLMISDNPHVIFIIGMDREKVAASIAVKHESLLPYLYSVKPGSKDSTHKSEISCADGDLKPECINGLRYGYEFLEKFIQVSFSVPIKLDLTNFLDQISVPAEIQIDGRTKELIAKTEKGKLNIYDKKISMKDIFGKIKIFFINIFGKIKKLFTFKKTESQREILDPEVPNEITDEKLILTEDKDSDTVKNIILKVASTLDNNPRRIKQFMNLFRLRIYIAKKTGLFDLNDNNSDKKKPTLEQLGMFVVISLKWPLLLKDLERDPSLLEKLQDNAVNKRTQAVNQWDNEEELMNFLCLGKDKKYNLSTLDVKRLLSISKSPIYQKEKENKEFLGMEFAKIEKGEFEMGSEPDKNDIKIVFENEFPFHPVKISKPFYLGIYPVTQKQWKRFMGENPSYFKGDDLPVERVSWNDIQKFIKKLNDEEGADNYRLPSEAEWEYAARAGTEKHYYYFGDDVSKLGDHAWYSGNSEGTTHPVGQKEPNPWGLYDVYGNVWEWVQDNWHEDYNEEDRPKDENAWESGKRSDRVVRGGCWSYYARSCRSASRNYHDSNFRNNDLGFRLLRKGTTPIRP